jgi:hypothetical protein
MTKTRTFGLGLAIVMGAAGAYGRTLMRPLGGDCVRAELKGVNGIPGPTLGMTRQVVSEIFATIGVTAELDVVAPKSPAPSCVEIVVEFSSSFKASFHPGALAYAEPYRNGGTQIYVFTDRILTGPARRDGTLLGHVIAHEIGHVMEAVSRHSSTGIMKATWTDADYYEMRDHALPFAPEDAQLIHSGFLKRRAEAE